MHHFQKAKRKAAPFAVASVVVLLAMLVSALLDVDPQVAHTRAALKLRAGKEVTVLVLGSSICCNLPIEDTSNSRPFSLFAEFLRQEYPAAEILPYRCLWQHEPIAEYARRAEEILQQLKPDITILCLGTGDYFHQTLPDAYNAACRSIIGRSRDLGGFVVVATGLLPQDEQARPIRIHTMRNAAEAGCVYIDLGAVLYDSNIPADALRTGSGALTPVAMLLVTDSLIRAWSKPIANGEPLPQIELNIYKERPGTSREGQLLPADWL